MIDHDTIEERIVAYVLGGMEPIERASFEAELEEHRPGCRRCQALFRDLSEVSTRLALAAPAVEPPADLEDRIVALATGIHSGHSAQERARSTWFNRAVLSAAAVVLLIAGFVGGAVAFGGGRAPGEVRIAAMEGTATGTFALAYVEGSRQAAVIAQGVPALPASRIYQLWVRGADGTMVGAGTFRSGVTRTTLPTETFDLVAVTEEPSGGSEQPTSTPIASAAVTG